MHDPDHVDAVKRQRLDGDDHPAHITAYQAQKCAAIVEAYVDGQTLYQEHVNVVAQFLKTAALEAALGVPLSFLSSGLGEIVDRNWGCWVLVEGAVAQHGI